MGQNVIAFVNIGRNGMTASIVANQRLKEKCQIFTPADVVTDMLDLANYKDKLYGKKVLENSCGNGEFLLQIVRRYITSCQEEHLSLQEIKNGIERDIVAYEIDKNRILECIERLNKLVEGYKIFQVAWDIRCADFLASDREERFDFIIGNPPYIAYPDLPEDVRKDVREKFTTCKKGKFDYSYAFIEKSYHCLADKGTLVYIIPSNIFKNVFSSQLRMLIKADIETILDFPDDGVFEEVLVSPAIIKVIKGLGADRLTYRTNEIQKTIEKASLGDKWNFCTHNRVAGTRLGDYFKVSSSVATLLNDAFVVKNGTIDNGYYVVGNFKIETGLLRKAASPKNKRYNKFEEYIIFPYYFGDNGKLNHYSEDQMYEKFPFGMEYLESYRPRLEKRKSDQNALWFEYGRTQALQAANRQMILISSIISDCTQAYLLEKDEVPYSGLYIVPTGTLTLDTLVSVLNSEQFKKYIYNTGICVSGKSRRVTPVDIENYIY